ncbi:MAG: ATPase [Armatimonadetes bacterium CG07_land_8_20_14_0_80_40_9]|nr:MAG: ATPase [Armatimonadetes bacterium CG07_land_8_20_14_0_80_40_9]
MIKRHFWLKKIKEAWEKHSVVWLSGVRRVGKTYLCQSLPEIEYFDCELPRIRRMIEDPESFLDDMKERTIVLDEIHRLDNPSEILKIAADHYSNTRVLATGSSTLGTSAKFRDTLAGRKSELWLTPMTSDDLVDFNNTNLKHRFLHGGLPPFFLAKSILEHDFQEWMDAYWAKDIQELFRIERRHSFLKFAELLIVQSGGIFEANKFARPCEVSRSTISNYLSVLEATYIVNILRPFSTHHPTEIISAPKVYAFDTGFVCYYRGWQELRKDDLGILWEHFVLNEIQAHMQSRRVLYWRDKSGHEVDFVLIKKQSEPIAIECKWSTSEFEPKSIKAFRRKYPQGNNFVVATDVKKPFSRRYNDIQVKFLGLKELIYAFF